MTTGNWGRRYKEKHSFDHNLQNLCSKTGLSFFCTGVSLQFKKQEKKKLNTEVVPRRRGFPICFPMSNSSMEERGGKGFNQKETLSFPDKVLGGDSRSMVPVPQPAAFLWDAADATGKLKASSLPKPPGWSGIWEGLFKSRLFYTQKKQEPCDQRLLATGCLFTDMYIQPPHCHKSYCAIFSRPN